MQFARQRARLVGVELKIYSRKRKKNALRWLLHKTTFQINFRKLKMSNYMTCTTLSRLDLFQSPTEEVILAQRFIPSGLAQNAIKDFHMTVVLHF